MLFRYIFRTFGIRTRNKKKQFERTLIMSDVKKIEGAKYSGRTMKNVNHVIPIEHQMPNYYYFVFRDR